MGSRLINARSETVAEKPSFRSALRRRRCIVPADGFFEWKKNDDKKTPCWVHREDREAFGMAGLWEKWEPKEGEPLYTFTILTRDATPDLRDLHPRMPVILPAARWDEWLDTNTSAETLGRILETVDGPPLSAFPVSDRVNAPHNDDPSLVQPRG
jgi:putative SOS response-associated peptidase YedK